MMDDLIAAVGLALLIEGALYTLFPEGMKKMMIQVVAQPLSTMRGAGLVAAFAGVAVVWLVRG